MAGLADARRRSFEEEIHGGLLHDQFAQPQLLQYAVLNGRRATNTATRAFAPGLCAVQQSVGGNKVMAEAEAIIAAGVNLESSGYGFSARRPDDGFDNGRVSPELQRDDLASPAVSKAARLVKPHPPVRHVNLDDKPSKKIRAENAVASPLSGLP